MSKDQRFAAGSIAFHFLLIVFLCFRFSSVIWTNVSFHFWSEKKHKGKGKDPSHLFSLTCSVHSQTYLIVFFSCPSNLQQHCELIYQLKLAFAAATGHQEHCPLCLLATWNKPGILVSDQLHFFSDLCSCPIN